MPASRKYLVVVRAGDNSLHSGWTDAPATRDWDLVVSYYGADPSRFRDASDRRIDDRGPKWPGLHALLTRETFWREYDYIWLPDDDLAIGQTAISRLFSLAAELNLELAQPALSWRSFYSHEITVRHPSFVTRYTDFVEIMAPCFSAQLLESCLPLFGETQSGWGLDWLLPLKSKTAFGCAIVDEVEVTHTRPVGGPNYTPMRSKAAAQDEAKALAARHGFRKKAPPQILGAIERGGQRLDAAVPEQASRLRELLAKDMMAFHASRLRVETSDTLVALAQPRAAGRSQS